MSNIVKKTLHEPSRGDWEMIGSFGSVVVNKSLTFDKDALMTFTSSSGTSKTLNPKNIATRPHIAAAVYPVTHKFLENNATVTVGYYTLNSDVTKITLGVAEENNIITITNCNSHPYTLYKGEKSQSIPPYSVVRCLGRNSDWIVLKNILEHINDDFLTAGITAE